MPDTTARLGLPILAAAQAQKHVTHNEALQILDAIVQITLDGIGTETPPSNPANGETHALGAVPIGAWADYPQTLAQWQNGQWIFVIPQNGWLAWDRTGGSLRQFDQTEWRVTTENLSGLGVGTQSDSTNRLSVSGPATLLNHGGAGHQLKLNKASSGDTVSLLYQSAWAGHAEIGLTGDNDLHIKTSADGGTWQDALIIDAATGHLTGEAVQVSASDTTSGRLARADFTYSPGNLLGSVSQAAGVPTGAVMESGSNANGSYTRFADGTQICSREVSLDINQSTGALFWSGATAHDFPIAFHSTPVASGAIGDISTAWLNARAVSQTQWEIAGFSTTSTTGNTAQLIAIGRWF